MYEDRPANGRLDSWKEIASYLNRDVRTVIRWQSNGLPVHRVPGGKRKAVFALTSEIDAWLLQHDSPPAVSSGGSAAAMEERAELSPGAGVIASSGQGSPAVSRAQKRMFILGGILLVAAMITIVAAFAHPPDRAVLQPVHLAQLTDDGRNKINLRTDGKFLYFNEFEGSHEVLASIALSGGAIRKIPTLFPNVELHDVSRDGQYLLISSFVGTETERPIWYLSTQDGVSRRIGDLVCHSARWSPGNQRVACATGTAIIVADFNGLHKRSLPPFNRPPAVLAWSPDGSRLRLVLQDASGANSPWEIAVPSDAATASPAVQLNLGIACCLDWAWGRPDAFFYMGLPAKGRTALFLQRERSSWIDWTERNFAIPVDIGTLQSIAPASSGNSLFALIDGPWRGQLLKVNGEKAFEAVFPGLSAVYLSFSPDGQWMTYTNTVDQSLWRSRADGSNTLLLSRGFEYVQFSSWSPDGRRIAFMGKMPGRPWRIFLVDRDGGAAVEAAPGEDSQGAPTWSSDGQKLAYGTVLCTETQSCRIRTVDLKSRHVEDLPKSQGFRTARWSPDGKYIAAFVPDKHQIMLFNLRKHRWRLLAESVNGDNLSWSHDSQFVYADSPQGERPVIERFRVGDGQRSKVVSLSELQKAPGQTDFWFGLMPDDSPILVQRFTGSEVYALDWKQP